MGKPMAVAPDGLIESPGADSIHLCQIGRGNFINLLTEYLVPVFSQNFFECPVTADIPTLEILVKKWNRNRIDYVLQTEHFLFSFLPPGRDFRSAADEIDQHKDGYDCDNVQKYRNS